MTRWAIESTIEFDEWWHMLDEFAQGSISSHADLLKDLGPNLGYPYSSDIAGSRHGNLRELRVQSKGRPFRVFYAFNPRRDAILLIGGDKTGDKRFYERMIPIADRLYDQHLREIGDKNG
jgi:hypothetical protein